MYTISVKRITFSADPDLIEKARSNARLRGTTLNEAFREWLAGFVDGERDVQNYRELVESLRHVQPGRHFTRSEMNQRKVPKSRTVP